MIREYCYGPLNDNYGYTCDLVAPLDQVQAAASLSGNAMWTALENVDWVDVDELPVGTKIYDSSALADKLTVYLEHPEIVEAENE